MFALGFTFMNGLAVAMSISVLVVLLASITLLPTLLRYLGIRVGRLGHRRQKQEDRGETRVGVLERWVGFVQRHAALTTIIGSVLVLAIAVPALSIRLGSSDTGNDNPTLTTRQAYDLLSEGFGPGFNAPLQLAVQLPKVDDRFPADQTRTDAPGHTAGSPRSTSPRSAPAERRRRSSPIPSTSPQSGETTDLVKYLRKRRGARRRGPATGAEIYIGGGTATNIDFTKLLSEKLFFFIGIVVLLSALLLMVVFRSLVIPIQAAVMNLMSIGACSGTGATRVPGRLAARDRTGADRLLPAGMVFSIVFGLSMDYEVFLISRIHEEWLHTGTTRTRSGSAWRAPAGWSPRRPP